MLLIVSLISEFGQLERVILELFAISFNQHCKSMHHHTHAGNHLRIGKSECSANRNSEKGWLRWQLQYYPKYR